MTCDVCVGGGGEFVVTERTHIHTSTASTSHTARTPALKFSHERPAATQYIVEDERSRNGCNNGTGQNGR